MILPNNDDGDFTYYKRRGKSETLPLIGGTGQPTQAAARPARPRPTGAQAGCPANAAAAHRVSPLMPSADPSPTGFATVQFLENGVPAALGFRTQRSPS
jgi:hypothetical protein